MLGKFRKLISALGSLTLVVGLLLSQASADVEKALNYLSAQQQVDGRVSSQETIASDFQSTTESLRAMEFSGGLGHLDQNSASTFLGQSTHRNTEALARMIVINSITGVDSHTLFNELYLNQNIDGGFGDFEGYPSTILDTAFALDAIAEKGSQLINSSNAISYLLGQQQSNGSWEDANASNSIYTTALTMRTLWHYRDMFQSVAPSLAGAQQYLLSHRNPDTGLWDEVYLSALSLIALIPNVSEFSQVESMLNQLLALQQGDGSWNGDSYITSLALRAISSQPTPVQPTVSTGLITGKISNKTTSHPITDAIVEIPGLSVSITTDSSGNWVLGDLAPGEYSLVVTNSGYAPVSLSNVFVTAGVSTNLGEIFMSEIPTIGIIQGTVTASATNQAVDNAIIQVAGAANASVTSDLNGNYSLVGLDPGQVVIMVTKSGFLPLSTPATIVAGGSLIFNPVLSAVTTESEPDSNVASTGSIRGTISDVDSGLPLQSAYVRVVDKNSGQSLGGIFSSADGTYQIDDLEPVDVNISVSRSGYLPVSASGRVYAGNYIVFDAGLVVTDGDSSNATGDTSLEPMDTTPATGNLSGVATDQETGLALSGVSISMTGSNTASTVTGPDGSFAFSGLVPGDIQVTATLNGYQGIQGSGEIVAGNKLMFNPVMMPDGFATQNPGGIIGRVVKSSSGDVIYYALVQISDGVNEEVARTSGDGSFEILDLIPGNYVLTVTRSGYVDKSIDVVIASDSIVDLGILEMMRDLNEVIVFGQVLDEHSGLPIEDAVVSVAGSIVSTQTDSSGSYRLEGVDTGVQTIMVSATGYNSKTLTYSFSNNGEFKLNHELGETSSNGVNITFLGTDRSVYQAYQPVEIQASVTNNGNPIEAMINFTLFDSLGNIISDYSGTLPNSTETLVNFPTGQITETIGSFNTANLPPGDYRLIGRVLIGNQLVGPSTVILDEKTANISIEETRKVTTIEVDVQPPFSAVGNTENVVVSATILNRSNVDTSISFIHRLTDPGGTVLYTSDPIQIPLPSGLDSIIVKLDEYTHSFTQSGEYEFNLTPLWTQTNPDSVTNDIVSVAPGLRVEPGQTLSPQSVTPDGDKRIRIDIRLQGMEVN